MSTNIDLPGLRGGMFYDYSHFKKDEVAQPTYLTDHLHKLSNHATTKFETQQQSSMNATNNTTMNNENSPKIKYPINEALYKLNKAKMALPSQNNLKSKTTTSKQPIYYKPPSSRSRDDQYGIKNFLPPNFNHMALKENKNRIPLFPMEKKISISDILPKQPNNTDDDDENAESVNPLGDWVNPIVKEALSRQVNEEYEVKSMVWNIIYIIAFHLIISFIKYLILLYDNKKLPFQKSNGFYPPINQQLHIEGLESYVVMAIRIINLIFVLKCGRSLYMILKSQDQCHDLPLTDKQRKLLGLSVSKKFDSSDDTDLIIKNKVYDLKHKNSYQMPKYSKLNAYSMYQFKRPRLVNPANQSLLSLRTKTDEINNVTEPADILCPGEKFYSSNVHRMDENTLKEKFQKHFNLEMNYADEEELVDNILESSALTNTAQVEKSVFRRRYNF